MPGSHAYNLPTMSKQAIEEAGFRVVEEAGPSFLLDGAVLVTGEIPRVTEYEQGMPAHEVQEGGGWVNEPLILDDQSIVLNLRDRGMLGAPC